MQTSAGAMRYRAAELRCTACMSTSNAAYQMTNVRNISHTYCWPGIRRQEKEKIARTWNAFDIEVRSGGERSFALTFLVLRR